MNKEDKSLWDFHETQNRQSFKLARPRLDFIIKRIYKLKKYGKTLDIGIGDGYLLEGLSKGFEIFGIDISEQNIESTKKLFAEKNIKANLQLGSIDKMPFQDNTFDFIVASDVLEHIDKEKLKKALKEIYRILSKEGFFLVTVPADENLSDNICFCPKCGNVYHRWEHKQTFNEETIQNIFLENDFQIMGIKRVTFFGAQMNTESFLNKLKYLTGKILFGLFKRVFAPQWWFFLEVKNSKS